MLRYKLFDWLAEQAYADIEKDEPMGGGRIRDVKRKLKNGEGQRWWPHFFAVGQIAILATHMIH